MLTVNELFAGIGAFRKALIRLGIPHEIVGISEIDKYAIKSYNAIYGETRNYGDISKVERLDYADLWTYGFPCQDISLAGQLKGIVKGETRSGLLYEVQRLLAQAQSDDALPKYLIMENVKNLVGKKFRPDFEGWLEWLDELGYNNYWKVLNAVDYGIPQNRERVFCISIRKDIDTGYTFPSPVESDTVLMDKLEPVEDIDEKYFLSNECVKRRFTKNQINEEKGYGFKFSPVEREEAKIATTVTTIPRGHEVKIMDNRPIVRIAEATKKGFAEATIGDSINIAYPNSKLRRGRVGKGRANTLSTSPQQAVITEDSNMENIRIRKLTPRECWRLMGFDDEDFNKARAVNSDTQLYKQAGNSIVVNVLEAIMGNMFRNDYISQ